MNNADLIRSVSIHDVAAGYERLGIDRWSDHQLVGAVAEVLALARAQPADSFVLHAPLELVARSRLLPLVAPESRRPARLHLVHLAVAYEASGPPLASVSDTVDFDTVQTEAVQTGAAMPDPTIELMRAIDDGDLDATERAACRLAESTIEPVDIVRALADRLIARTAAAAHAPILLAYLATAGPLANALLPLLRPLARELARTPDAKIRWYDLARANGTTTTTGSLDEVLATTPHLGVPGSTFIHPIMMQVDEGGLAAERLGPVLLGRPDTGGDRSARAVLRIAARSMVDDTPEHAPYGWTHCLTLPQSVLALSRYLDDPNRGLAIAATHVLGFRAALGTTDLDQRAPLPEAFGSPWERMTALASRAATRHDAHIVKYSLAVIEASWSDREAAGLYLDAGEHLLNVWDNNGGDPQDALE